MAGVKWENITGGAVLADYQPAIYVSNFLSHTMTAYVIGADGNTLPVQYFTVTAGLSRPFGIYFFQDEIYISQKDIGTNITTLNVYSATNMDNSTFTRVFTKSMNTIDGIFVNATGLYCGNFVTNCVNVYNHASSLDPSPSRTYTKNMSGVTGIDVANNELYVANYTSGEVNVYDSNSALDPSPTRTFTDSMVAPIGLAVYQNELYVGSSGDGKIYVYNALSALDPAPTRTITVNTDIYGIAVYNDLLYVADGVQDKVFVYNGISGTLLRTITGNITFLSEAKGIAIRR